MKDYSQDLIAFYGLDPRAVEMICRDENEPLWLGDDSAGDLHWDKTGQRFWEGLVAWFAETVTDLAMVKGALGKLTAGFGKNMEISRSRESWLSDSLLYMAHMRDRAAEYPWYASLNGARQAVIVSMIYQMGPTGFAGFKRMIAHIQVGVSSKDSTYAAWSFAGDEMEDSAWHSQTPRRSEELAEMMRTGEWPMSEAA